MKLSTYIFTSESLPYRNLNYKAQKFAMVLSSLAIHGINGLRTTLVIFGKWAGGSIAQLFSGRMEFDSKSEGRWLKSQLGDNLSFLQCCFQANSTCWNLLLVSLTFRDFGQPRTSGSVLIIAIKKKKQILSCS